MKIEEAIIKSIRKYFVDNFSPEELAGSKSEKSKYNKKYFDSFGENYGVKPYGNKDEDEYAD